MKKRIRLSESTSRVTVSDTCMKDDPLTSSGCVSIGTHDAQTSVSSEAMETEHISKLASLETTVQTVGGNERTDKNTDGDVCHGDETASSSVRADHLTEGAHCAEEGSVEQQNAATARSKNDFCPSSSDDDQPSVDLRWLFDPKVSSMYDGETPIPSVNGIF